VIVYKNSDHAKNYFDLSNSTSVEMQKFFEKMEDGPLAQKNAFQNILRDAEESIFIELFVCMIRLKEIGICKTTEFKYPPQTPKIL